MNKANLHLIVVGPVVPLAQEGPYEHVAAAIQSLILADERLAVLMMPVDPMLMDLIRAAEARCFHALFQLGAQMNG
jgi:hypothetical protein